jgi:hypothetical protein
MSDCSEGRIDGFGAGNGDFEQGFGACLAFFDQIGEREGIVAAVFFKCHGLENFWLDWRKIGRIWLKTWAASNGTRISFADFAQKSV